MIADKARLDNQQEDNIDVAPEEDAVQVDTQEKALTVEVAPEEVSARHCGEMMLRLRKDVAQLRVY